MAEKSLAIGFKLKGATTYTIEKQLHQGGFGITYLATAQIMVGNIPQAAKFTIKEFFISKICNRDANGVVVVAQEHSQVSKQAKQDFREEAEMLHSLKHDNIVPVNEVFEQNNTVYYVMAFLGNVSLYQYVSEHGGCLQENQAKEIVTYLSGAISYLHHQHILHLDIKPGNIMMVGEGASVNPVLIDFGQAMYFVNGKPRRSKGISGYSKGYSPMELKQPVSNFLPTLDIYSLAATLLYMLTGHEPCEASVQSIHKIYRALPENISQNTMDAIICGMQKDENYKLRRVVDFQNVLSYGKSTLNVNGTSNTSESEPLVTDPIIPNSTHSYPAKKTLLFLLCLVIVGVVGYIANQHGSQKKGHIVVFYKDSLSNDSLQKDSLIKDSLRKDSLSKVIAQKTPTDTLAKPKPDVVNPPTPSPKPTPSPSPTPQPKTSKTSGFVNLGYATWTGGLLNGKPHGNGRMKFYSSHAISGCTTTPTSGDYIDGYCENGILQNGALYHNGEKVESFVR